LYSLVGFLSRQGLDKQLQAALQRATQVQVWVARQQSICTGVDELGKALEMADGHVDNLLVDGLNLAFRCLHALSAANLTGSNGEGTGVVYGFLRALGSMRKRFPQAKLYVCWDSRDGSDRRRALYAGYKANRPKGENGTLSRQLLVLQSILPQVGVYQAQCQGEEADDVIATLVRGQLAQQSNVIYGTDRDMLQLVTWKDVVLTPKQGSKPEGVYDPDAVLRDYGVMPAEFLYLRAFLGDESDHIPRCPKVPKDVLVALVRAHKTVEGVYASNFGGLSPAQYATLVKFKGQALVNLELMRLRTDVAVALTSTASDKDAAEARLISLSIQHAPLLAPFFPVSEQLGFFRTAQ
jgi:DNA polymerase-1